MTYEEREKIFSKEVLTLNDMAELLSIDISTASILMKQIRHAMGDKLNKRGRIFVDDYLRWKGVDEKVIEQRYQRNSKPHERS